MGTDYWRWHATYCQNFPIGRAPRQCFQRKSCNFGDLVTNHTDLCQSKVSVFGGSGVGGFWNFCNVKYQQKVSSATVRLGTIQICDAKAGKTSSTLLTIHCDESWGRRSVTTKSRSHSLLGPKGRRWDEVEIQASFNTFVVRLLPIAFPSLSSSKSLPSKIPLEPWEANLEHSTERK